MKIRLLAAAAFLGLSAVLSACDSSNGSSSTPAASGSNSNSPAQGGNSGSGNTGSIGKRPIIVSSKDFTEQVILGNLYSIALQSAGVPVNEKLNLGGTDIAQAALLKGGGNGGIDIYPEYTGTGLIVVLKSNPINDPDQAFDAVKKGYEDQFHLTWLNKTPMNDTQAFVTTMTNSQKLNLKSIQDLCDKAGDITLAARAEFKDRADALPAVQKIYGGCNFKEIKAVTAANLLYQSLVDGQVDAAQADSTAGEISGNNLVLLEDPKHYGPPNNVSPIVRDDVLAAYPQIADTLNAISAKVTNDEMTKMNWDVAGKGMDPHDVAKKWLYDQGILKK